MLNVVPSELSENAFSTMVGVNDDTATRSLLLVAPRANVASAACTAAYTLAMLSNPVLAPAARSPAGPPVIAVMLTAVEVSPSSLVNVNVTGPAMAESLVTRIDIGKELSGFTENVSLAELPLRASEARLTVPDAFAAL
jgi:hypothetical protein